MTVAELIKALSSLDPDLRVVMIDEDTVEDLTPDEVLACGVTHLRDPTTGQHGELCAMIHWKPLERKS